MKTPLLLVSGLLCNKDVWEYQMRHLSYIADIQTVAPREDTPKKMVQEILKEAPEEFALAGHSMGGWLSLEVMRTAPSRVKKLCLLNTTARADTQEKRDKRIAMIAACESGHFEEIVDDLVNNFVYNPAIKSAVRQMLISSGKEAFINQEKAMLQRTECLSLLPKIVCPTLIVYARHDKVFSLEEHQEMRDLIPNARLALIEDSGHMSPMEMPQAVTALMRLWLEDNHP